MRATLAARGGPLWAVCAVLLGACQGASAPTEATQAGVPAAETPSVQAPLAGSGADLTEAQAPEVGFETRKPEADSGADSAQIPPPPVPGTGTPDADDRAGPSPFDVVSELQATELRGTSWNAAAPGARFARIEFLDTAVTLTTVDGQVVSFPADYSAQSTACTSFPGCVLTIEPDGSVQPFHFARDGEALFHVACIDPLGATRDEWEQARASELLRNRIVVHDRAPGFCWNTLEPPYVAAPPTWFRVDDPLQANPGAPDMDGGMAGD